MDTLLPYAEKLAKQPPVDVYKALNGWYEKYLKARFKQDFGVDKVWDTNVEKDGLAAATYAVGAICDLTAMSMMMVAAGVSRVEKMKNALRTTEERNEDANRKVRGRVFEDANLGDRAYIYDSNGTNTVKGLLDTWCNLKGNGVVQLKFNPGGDWHTLAIERVQEKEQDPSFIVYQSYQNVYRLLDFMGLGDAKDQATHQAKAWKPDGKNEDDDQGQLKQAFIERMVERIGQTADNIGKKQLLTLGNLKLRVLNPICSMLAGPISNEDYVLLTASTTQAKQVSASLLGLMVCDTVKASEYSKNYDEYLQPHADLTSYVECG